jgi:hypothetical protein
MRRIELRLERSGRAGIDRREDYRQAVDFFPSVDGEIDAEAGPDDQPGKRNRPIVKRRQKRQQQLLLPIGHGHGGSPKQSRQRYLGRRD